MKPEGSQSCLVCFICVAEDHPGIRPDPDSLLGDLAPQIYHLLQDTCLNLETKVPKYMVPTKFVPLNYIPVTRTGKVDRSRLLKLAEETNSNQVYSPDGEVSADKQAPANETERILQKLVGQILQINLSEVGLNCQFSTLGANSLQAMQLVSKLRKQGYRNVSVNDVLSLPSLLALAMKMRESVEVE